MNPFINYLKTVYPIADSLLNELNKYVQRKQFRKGQILLSAGQVCEQIYLFEKGLARSYHINDHGNEVTCLIMTENDLIISPQSLFNNKATSEYIELLENSILWQITYKDLLHLQEKHHEVALLSLRLTEKVFLRYEEWNRTLKGMTTEESYQTLIKLHPQILLRTSQSHIASFLGITSEHLSRVRKKLATKV